MTALARAARIIDPSIRFSTNHGRVLPTQSRAAHALIEAWKRGKIDIGEPLAPGFALIVGPQTLDFRTSTLLIPGRGWFAARVVFNVDLKARTFRVRGAWFATRFATGRDKTRRDWNAQRTPFLSEIGDNSSR